MKTLVLGLESADADLLFGLEDLPFLRRLMEVGCYGRLESVVPPASIPAWMCLATGQDPGSLGIYGSRSSVEHSEDAPGTATFRSVAGQTIWDHLGREGKPSILVGVPPTEHPWKIHGISVGWSLTPDTDNVVFTHPSELSQEIRTLVGRYPNAANESPSRSGVDLAEQILAMSQTQFRVVRHLMQTKPWDYFQFVDIGLDRLHHGFMRNHDFAHDERGADSLHLETLRPYYRHLDDEIGKVLELLDEETVVLVVSPHGPHDPEAALPVSDRDNCSELGAFILAGPIRTLGGEVRGARLVDIAPTLLDLGGHEIPRSMQGRSLVELGAHESPGGGRPDADEEQLIRERLSGLGYI